MFSVFKAFFISLSLIVLSGCVAKKSGYHAYTLAATPSVQGKEPSAQVKEPSAKSLPASIGVFPVELPGWLDRKNITWSDGDVRLIISGNDRWGEPLPQVLTQVMAQNLRRLTRGYSQVSTGPWIRSGRPDNVIVIQVQSMAVVNQQLRVNVVWLLEGEGKKVISHREKVYALLLEENSTTEAYVQTLSRIWGLVAKDVVLALPGKKTAS